jgi:hypothetical protein
MKRLLLVFAVASAALFVAPAESEAACGRFRHRVGAVLRAPFKLAKAIRGRRCNCAANTNSHAACSTCSQ